MKHLKYKRTVQITNVDSTIKAVLKAKTKKDLLTLLGKAMYTYAGADFKVGKVKRVS